MNEENVLGQNQGMKALSGNRQVILVILSLLLGILFDWLIFDKLMGVSYPLFVFAYYGLLFWSMEERPAVKPDMAWGLSLPVLLLSFTFFFFNNPVFKMINFMAVPVLLIAQSILLTRNQLYAWYTPGFILDLLYGMFFRIFAYIFKPFKIVAARLPRRKEGLKYSAGAKVAVGLLISLPLVLVVVALLASADLIFENYVQKIPNLFTGIPVEEYIVRFVLIMMVFLLSFSFIWSLAAGRKPVPPMAGDGSVNVPRILDPVVSMTVLLVINFIYILFVLVQFAYLFGGAAFALPSDFTYSAYARRGFFELIAVTLINFCVLLGAMGLGKRTEGGMGKALKVLYSLLVGCTGVMLISAYYRMLLYEESYGYTHLRVLPQAFMVFLLFLFAAILVRIWKEGFPLTKWFIGISLAALIAINYINVDALIARNNIDRYVRTGMLDENYLTRLSSDAVPELARLLDDKDAEKTGIVQAHLQTKKEELSRQRPWQSFNLSDYLAGKALE